VIQRSIRPISFSAIAILLVLSAILFVMSHNSSAADSVSDDESGLAATAPESEATPYPVLPMTQAPAENNPDQADTEIELPSSDSGQFTLQRSPGAEVMSLDEALDLLREFGVPYVDAERWEGNEIDLSADYGLATFGRPDESEGDADWGDQYIHLNTGEVLEHIAERPHWILDFAGAIWPAAQFDEDTEPDPVLNHTVFAIDALTGTIWKVWAYHDPKLASTE
jgi:hypothetical protein